MTDFTTILGLPKPESTESPDGPTQIGALADALDELVGDRAFAQVATSESTSGTSFADLATVGPEVSLEVPADSLVAVFAQVTIAPGVQTGTVGLYEATDIAASAAIMAGSAGTHTRRTVPGSAVGVESSAGIGGALVFAATAGTRTYRLRYKVGAGSVSFSARKLWAWVIPFP